jgi:hypothetical protein
MLKLRMACAVLLTSAALPAAAQAQYEAPPPEPGFQYIFDGSATGSAASFDQWRFAGSTLANSDSAGRATLGADGAIHVGPSPFGAYWYAGKPFGDAVFKIHYTVEDTPTSTRNGGVMIRAPYVRYDGADTNAVLAQKPTGFNFDPCPGALAACGRTEPAQSTTYTWPGTDGPFPPGPFEYTGAYCARSSTAGQYNVNGLNGLPLTVNGSANNHEHWTQVYCGHEVQINESLNGGGPNPSSDPIKTGSIYGFRNLNAKQSGTDQRLQKGVWHEMEIRTIGQQFTVLIDGKLVNQFDNAIPKIASRAGDPPTMARQLTAGYLGLQTHGGNDRISYREIAVKEVAKADIPVNTVAPTVSGPGYQGVPLTCDHGQWQAAPGTQYWVRWYRGNKVPESSPRLRAPSQLDYWNATTPAEPQYGTNALPWLDWQIVGTEATYTPTADDVGKALYCQVSADNAGATVFRTAGAPEILSATNAGGEVGGSVPATLSLTLGAPASFGAFQPGVAREYAASTTANVISTAGNATLTVADPSTVATGHLVNGTFALPQPLQGLGTVKTYDAPVSNDVVTVELKQAIGAGDALRTGSYSKTLTFTLSTTEP